jgi:putative membrane protein
MKLKKLTLSVLVLGSSTMAYNAFAVDAAPTSNEPTAMTQTADKAAKANKLDARQEKQILGIFVALNKNEINAAKIAMKNTKNKDVDDFAQMMDKAHSENLENVMKLSKELKLKPTSSKISMAMKNAGKKEGEKLKSLHDNAFDTAYMDAMVKGHEKALELIDKALADTSNENVKSYLQATRKHVEEHLELAKKTQSKLPN